MSMEDVPLQQPAHKAVGRPRKRWNSAEHQKWIKRVYGSQVFPGSDELLAEARANRKLV